MVDQPQSLYLQKRLRTEHKKSIGQQAISGSNISHVAQRHQVYRNTVYAQRCRVQAAIDDAFLEPDLEEQVLFSLPVTKPFLQQMVLGILSICKGSYRDVQMFLRDLFDADISIGTIFNVHDSACRKVTGVNAAYSLDSSRAPLMKLTTATNLIWQSLM